MRKALQPMAVSIVVVTWECAPELERLADSMNLHLDGTQELVVVDNASSDDPAAAAGRWRGPSRFLRLDRNHGFGAAANAGVEQASGEAVVILNPDTELADDRLPGLAAEALRRNSLVGPRVLNPDGTIQPSASGPPVGAWPWVRAILPSPVGPRPVLRRTAPWRLDEPVRVAWLTGACLAGPRDVLAALGPFDTSIHMYGEDLDLGLRATQAGVESWFVPGACAIVHYGKGSTAKAYPDAGRRAAAVNGRAALARAHGERRARLAWWAERTNLRLRVIAKTALRRDCAWERLTLDALRKAGG
jgi:N-acetylglucosaminyl-diphospho-decaprenol L-rhamnosyltransferase